MELELRKAEYCLPRRKSLESDSTHGIFLIECKNGGCNSNHVERLDPALKRPGELFFRFERNDGILIAQSCPCRSNGRMGRVQECHDATGKKTCAEACPSPSRTGLTLPDHVSTTIYRFTTSLPISIPPHRRAGQSQTISLIGLRNRYRTMRFL